MVKYITGKLPGKVDIFKKERYNKNTFLLSKNYTERDVNGTISQVV